MFIRAIVAQIALYYKLWVLLWISYVIFAMNLSLLVMLFVFMNVWRWSHPGRVCSGDFLENKSEGDKDVYLIMEGKFLKMILMAIYLVFGLSLFTVCCVSLLAKRRDAPDGEKERYTALNLPLD